MTPFVPFERQKTERFPVSDIREGEPFSRIALSHIRETEGGFRVAFGYSLDYSFPDGCTRVFMVDSDVFTYNPSRERMQCITTGKHWSGLNEPQFLYHYVNNEGEDGYYSGGEKQLAYLYSGGTRYFGNRSAYAAVIHHDRVFYIGLDYRLSYSPAIVNDNANNSGADPQLAGDITLMRGDGKFVEIASFRDRVYAFRERAIVRLRADGEPLNYKAEILPMPCGIVRLHTLQIVGDSMLFFTEKGFFSYDGENFKRIDDTAFELLDLSAEKGWESTRRGKDYFCIVPKKEGGTGFLYYDTEHGRATFLNFPATSVATGDYVSFAAKEKYSYRLTDCGLNFEHEPCRLTLTVRTGKRALDGVTVHGRGAFALTVQADGVSREFEGSMDSRIRFPVPLRAKEAELVFAVSDLNFCLTELELHWREYDD